MSVVWIWHSGCSLEVVSQHLTFNDRYKMPRFPKLKVLIFSFGLGVFCAVTLFPDEKPKSKNRTADVSSRAGVYRLESGSQATCEDALVLTASESIFKK